VFFLPPVATVLLISPRIMSRSFQFLHHSLTVYYHDACPLIYFTDRTRVISEMSLICRSSNDVRLDPPVNSSSPGEREREKKEKKKKKKKIRGNNI